MLYAIQSEKTREQLGLIPVPRRTNVGEKWMGIQHGYLANTLVNRLEAANFTVTEERWMTGCKDAALFGCVLITPPPASNLELKAGHDAQFALCIRHSNISRIPLSISIGAQLPCKNMLFVEDKLLHQHSCGLDLVYVLDKAIARYADSARKINPLVIELLQHDLSQIEAESILFSALREELIDRRRAMLVHEAWWHSPHPSYLSHTAMGLYRYLSATAGSLPYKKQVSMARRLVPFMERMMLRGRE